MGLIDDNLREVRGRIRQACDEAGRRPEEITLVAVSKSHDIEAIREAWQAGLTHFGENRVQEAARKIPEVGLGPIWHMIGHLQTNKGKAALSLFRIIESVDGLRLAETLSRECATAGKAVDVLLEVNSSGETTKYGLRPEEVLGAAEEINRLDFLNLRGLMTLGPLTDEADRIGQAFGLTRSIFEQMRDKLGDKIDVLSMGMSADFEQAIRHGSTEVRVGTAIFGPRKRS